MFGISEADLVVSAAGLVIAALVLVLCRIFLDIKRSVPCEEDEEWMLAEEESLQGKGGE